MATKSVGTLAAKLTVDTQGWFAGFGKADKKQQQFASQATTRFAKVAATGRGLTGALMALGPAGIAAGAALGATSLAAFRAGRVIGHAMQSIDKEFATAGRIKERADASAEAVKVMGLSLSNLDIGKVLAANDSVAMLGSLGDAIAKKFAVAVGPTIITAVEHIIVKVQEIGGVLQRSGINWETAGNVFVAIGVVAVSAFDAIAAKVEQVIALGKIMAAQYEAAGAIIRLDFEGAAKAGEKAARFALDAGNAEGKYINAITGGSAKGFIERATGGSFGSRLGGDIGGITSPKTQTPFERGTKEAAQAIAGLMGAQKQEPINKTQGDEIIALLRQGNTVPKPQLKVARL